MIMTAFIHRRNIHELWMPKFRTALFQRSFTYNAVKIYNKYFDIFNSRNSVQTLKRQINKCLLLLLNNN